MNALPVAGAVFGVLFIAQSAPPTAQLPADVQSRETNLAQLAIEASQGDVRPIPLMSDGQRYGAVYDRFLLGVVAAKAAIAAGKTPSAESPSIGQGLVPIKIVIVAEPLTCAGRPNAPKDIQLEVSAPPFSGPVRQLAPPVKGDAAESILPGVKLPDAALVASFSNAPLSTATSVRIEYEAPACPNPAPTVTFSTQFAPARPRGLAVLKFPEGAAGLPSPSVLRFRVLVDQQGNVRFPSRVEGEVTLEPAALAALEKVTFEPSRINGAPVPATVVIPVTFTATGAPPVSAGPTPIANTTIGGRPAGNTTPDVPNLTVESSRCAISDDEKYGYTPQNPIKVDGGVREGPPRERRYLDTLRGPAGQGLRYRRLGSVMGPDQQTILDMYEVQYDGIVTPVRLYLDEYHSGDVKAPKGFVCATPFNLNR
ncbi:MAG TPA: energy transducer TonB [Vicinamibacterales bacterium]|nr:energy transducer TonB [Vicinamibacterales bacterium]